MNSRLAFLARRTLPLLLTLASASTLAAVGLTPLTSEVSRFGEANLSIPILAPPGVNNVQPKLDFVYRHRNTSTLLGRGWTIAGLSAVTRCGRTWAQDAVVSAVRNEVGDQFCLDGNRLRATSGIYGQDGATYQLELENFTRLTSFGVAGTGPQWFQGEGRDGLIYEYGHTADSRVESLGQSTPHTWQLNSVRDRSGNVMTYTYIEDANGASRISSIQYAANPNAGVTAPNEIVFVWEAKPAGDVEVRYLAGSPITETARLNRVDVNVNALTVRRYELTYESSLSPAGHSRLASIQECAGSPLDCRTPTSFSYHNRPTTLDVEINTAALPDATQSPLLMDTNRDGKPDLLYRSVAGGGNWTLRMATADGTTYEAPIPTPFAAPATGEVVIDYDGDGRMDLLYPQNGTWWMMQAAGSGFLAPIDTGVALEHASASGRNARAMDINGDGREDLVWAMTNTTGTNSIRYKLREVPGTFSATTYTLFGPMTSGVLPLNPFTDLKVAARSPDFDGDGRRDLVFISSEAQRRLNVRTPHGYSFSTQVRNDTSAAWGDFNGDGYTDLLYNTITGGNFVVYGSGTLFSAPVAVPSLPNSSQYTADRAVFDYDGDGREDVLVSDTSLPNWYLLKATNTGFAALVDTGQPKRAGAQVADLNGDGYLDLAYNLNSAWHRRFQGPSNPSLPADVLIGATDSYGSPYAFTYRSIADPAVYADVDQPSGAMQVVRNGVFVARTQSLPTGVVGSQETFTYNYEDMRWDPQRRLFLGFETVSRKSALTSFRRTVTYSLPFPFLGLVVRDETRISDAGAFVETLVATTSSRTYSSGSFQRQFAWINHTDRMEYEVGNYVFAKRNTITDYTMDFASDTYSSVRTDVREMSGANGLQPDAVYQIDQEYTQITSNTQTWCIGMPNTTVVTVQHSQFAGEVQSRRFDTTWDSNKCRPTTQYTDTASPTRRVIRTFVYDDDPGETQPDQGNLVRVTESATGQTNRVTRFAWSSGGQFLVQIINALNETRELTWNATVGQVATDKDANLIQTGFLYDGFGRKTRENKPDGTYIEWLYQNCSAVGCVSSNNRLAITETHRDTTGAAITDKTLYLDTFERPLATRQKMLLGDYSRADWEYNSEGELSRNSFPCTWSTATVQCTQWIEYFYDVVSRPITIRRPRSDSDATLLTHLIDYMGFAKRVRDASQEARLIIENVAGSVVQGQDNGGNTVTFDYDAFGRVRRIRDPAGTTLRTFTYNAVGDLTNTTDVDSGNWIYARDGWGQLASRTDANGKQILYGYDLLGRTTSMTLPEGAGTITRTFTFGSSSAARNIGKLEWMQTQGQGVTTFRQNNFFDAQGRPNRTTYVEGGTTTHEFLYGYNAQTGFIADLTYPVATGTFRMDVHYDYQNGQLLQVTSGGETMWRAQATNPRGNPTLEQVGVATNGVTMDIASTFDLITGLLKARSSTFTSGAVNGQVVQNLGYLWDDGRNLIQRQDNRQGLTENLYYDAMDRLDLAQRSTGQTTGDYSYDAGGNITFNSRLGNYSYTATVAGCTYYSHAQIHAVRQITASGQPTRNYCYDANGNMVNRNGTSISWYADNLPKAIVQDANNSSTFEYDAMGERWKHVYRIAGATHTTTYLSPLLERVQTPTTTDWKHYVYANGERIMVYVRRTNGAKNRYFFTKDNLGGVASFTDSNGSWKLNESFHVFGQRRGSDWGTAPTTWEQTQMTDTLRRGFTMHEHMDSTGLIHMNGRVYDPLLARFISPDPVLADPSNPQAHNRYSYVYNNPGTFSDPTGLQTWDPHNNSPELPRQPMNPNGGLFSLWARGHGAACGCVGGRGGPPNDPRNISPDNMGPVLSVAGGSMMMHADPKQLARMFLGTDASIALLRALRDRDPGQWVGNVTFNGEFGRYRPDLIYIGPNSFRLNVFEIKPLGSEALAVKDLEFYLTLPTLRSSFTAGNTELIFRGQGSLTVDAVWFFGRTQYRFYPGSAPGVVVYTINSQSDVVSDIADVIDELVKNGFGIGTAPWWDPKRRDNWKFP
ncbi:MAG TPA: FG-GAP-like repeat-containing protein [Steroidobacteraceae bacterium]|nr:FG-GAP-like repeat-containing protein [Steroidobacteraceae bacterium]